MENTHELLVAARNIVYRADVFEAAVKVLFYTESAAKHNGYGPTEGDLRYLREDVARTQRFLDEAYAAYKTAAEACK